MELRGFVRSRMMPGDRESSSDVSHLREPLTFTIRWYKTIFQPLRYQTAPLGRPKARPIALTIERRRPKRCAFAINRIARRATNRKRHSSNRPCTSQPQKGHAIGAQSGRVVVVQHRLIHQCKPGLLIGWVEQR